VRRFLGAAHAPASEPGPSETHRLSPRSAKDVEPVLRLVVDRVDGAPLTCRTKASKRSLTAVRNHVNDPFRFGLVGQDDARVLVFKGNLDFSADPAELELLCNVVRYAPPGRWTIDASALGFADSTAIRLLLDIGRLLRSEDELRVIATPGLARLIDLVCVPGQFTVEDPRGGRDHAPSLAEAAPV
jgi:anti-anti-sigma regulatory factor